MQASVFYQAIIEAIGTPITLCAPGILPEGLSPYIQQYLTMHQFTGKLGDQVLLPDADGVLARVFLGAGQNPAQALARAATRLPPGVYRVENELCFQGALNWSLAQYQYDAYKKTAKIPCVLAMDTSLLSSVLTMAESIFLTRDLINAPANVMTPFQLSEVTRTLAREYHATFEEWVGPALVAHQFPAIYAVGNAAHDAPRLLKLTAGNKTHPKVTLVGKGVCFDSGGLNLKSANHMRLMKKDMGGAAQVLGLAKWIMSERLPVYLQVWIPAVENAVGSDAYRPGDILTMRNGLTVEIDNTDAEGRLILADALVAACEDGPEILIDFATLTGAARVAVGTEISAVFSNDDALVTGLLEAGVEHADPLWRMPLYEGYGSLLDSSVADLVNSPTSPYAGAITAALFLKHFVTPGIAWAHFDVMAWNPSSKPGKPEGGEAMGLRATAAYLAKRFGNVND